MPNFRLKRDIQVLTAADIKMAVLWEAAPSLVGDVSEELIATVIVGAVTSETSATVYQTSRRNASQKLKRLFYSHITGCSHFLYLKPMDPSQ
jgi:predicted secreted protein